MKLINKITVVAAALLTLGCLSSCTKDVMEENTSLELSRCLQPMNLNARVQSAYGNRVTFLWDVTKDAESYNLVVYSDKAMTTEVLSTTLSPEEVPFVAVLSPDETYYFKVQAVASGKTDSKWAEYEKAIKTYAVKDYLYMTVTDRQATSLSFAWSKEIQDFKDVDRLEYRLPDSEEALGTKTLSAAEIDAAAASIGGLDPSTEYVVTLYFASASRGEVDVWTLPDKTGLTTVSTDAALAQAVADGANIYLTMEGSPYTLSSDPADLAKGIDLPKSVKIYGEGDANGARPVVYCSMNIPQSFDGGDLYFEGVDFNGLDNKCGFLIQHKDDKDSQDGLVINSIIFKNCGVTGYSKGLFYEWKKTVKIGEFTFDSCDIDLINGDGVGGGDGLDFRFESTVDKMNIINCTITNSFRTFFRNYPETTGNPATTFNEINFINNTVSNVCASTNSNNSGLFAFTMQPGAFNIKNNLFLNMAEKATLVSANARFSPLSDLNLSAARNYFYACPETFFTTNGSLQMVAGKMLSESPCYNAAGGYYNILPDSEIAGEEIGASKWWVAYVEELMDLRLNDVGERHTWDFTNAKYFTGAVKRSKVSDDLAMYVEKCPIQFEEGILNFTVASETTRKGIPTDGFLAFKVSRPGSVILKPVNGKDNHVVVAVGDVAQNDEVTIKSSAVTVKGGASEMVNAGTPQKIILSDITGESIVYIYASGPIGLETLAWSDDVAQVNTALGTPVVRINPASVTAGDAVDVTVSWDAVDYAGTYSVVFSGSTATVEEGLEYTIPAQTIGFLDAGPYKVEVYANPAEGDVYNTPSAAGVGAFAIIPAGGGDESGEFVVKNVDELNAAIAAGKTEIYLAPGNYEAGLIITVPDLKLRKQTGAPERPVITGAVKIAGLDQGNIVFEGLEFVGNSSFSNAFTVSNPSGDAAESNVVAQSVVIRDCFIHGYSKSVWYNPKGNKSTPESVIGSLVMDNNIIKDCTTGQNTVDIRDGHYDEVQIVENTFVNCAVSGADVFRIDDGQNGLVECPTFVVRNNTFYNCGAASGKAVFYVRETFTTYNVSNNLFLGTSSAAGKYSRSAVVFPSLSNNFFYSVGANWFSGDITADGTTLTASPVKNAEGGDFTLTNALVMSCRAGASRWNPTIDGGSGGSFAVSNMDELSAALSAGKTDLKLAPGTYDIGILSTVPGLRLTGADKNDKPVLNGAVKIAGEGLGAIVFENLKFVGGSSYSNAFTVSNPSGDSAAGNVSASSVMIRNCDIRDYSKSVWYNPKGNKSTPESDIIAVTFDGCLISNCTTGQNTIDIRDGKYGIVTIQNSTFSGCAISGAEVFRIDDGQNGKVEMDGFVVKNNTFYNCSAASGKSLFYVRENLSSYQISDNLFIGTDAAAGLFARARVAIAGLVAPTLSGNFFYSMGANIFGEKDDIKEGYGTILTASPVKDAAGGDFTLTNALVMSCNAGDPRWNPSQGADNPSDFFTVSSVEEFTNAISAGKTNILLAYKEDAYELGLFTLGEGMNLKGQVSFGKKPKVVGAFKLAGNLGNVSIESLDISGGSLANAFTVSNPSGDSAAGNVTAGIVTIKDCDIHDYSKSVWYNPKGNKSTPESEMTSVTITGCTVKNCTTGQNVIDIRDGKYGVFTVEKSTFSGCAVSGAEVFRIDDGQNGKVEMGAFVVKDNTFYNCSAASGKALFYVRENLDAYTIANNLFVGTESAAGLFARARVAIGGLVAPTLSGNYFYSMGANIFGEKDDIKEGYGTILETAPCTDPANGNFKLKTALAAGDPRWR